MPKRQIVNNLIKHLQFLGFFCRVYSTNTGTGYMYHSELIIDEYLVNRIFLGDGKSEEESLFNAILRMPKYYRNDF